MKARRAQETIYQNQHAIVSSIATHVGDESDYVDRTLSKPPKLLLLTTILMQYVHIIMAVLGMILKIVGR